MKAVWDCIRRFLDKCCFWLPGKYITEPMVNAILGFAHKKTGSHLKTLTWKQFQYECCDRLIILVGNDSGSADFIAKYGSTFSICGIVASGVDGEKEYRGYTLRDIAELSEYDIQNRVLVVTSIWNYRVYRDILEEKGVSEYYYYPQVECSRISHIVFRPLYYLRYRWFDFFFKPDGLWKNYIVFGIGGILRKLNFDRRYDRIRAMKDCHKGERCFIVATGPSLKVEDLERLRGETTIGVNSLFRAFGQTSWRPTYYALCDKRVYEQYLQTGERLDFDAFATEKAFLADTFDISLSDTNNESPKLVRVPFSYLNHMTTAVHTVKKYSVDPVWGLYNAQTVTNFAINLAHYMGFSEIYLLGVDFNYTANAHHFDGSICEYMLNEVIEQRVLEETLECYEMVQRETERAGIKVMNASCGTALKVFPIVNFNELTFLPQKTAGQVPAKSRADAIVPEQTEVHTTEEKQYEYMVSVIMLTYNHEKFIREAIDSILMQKVDFKYEVLIGDDCSLDNTQKILYEYEERYPDIFKIIYRPKNIGATKNAYELLMNAKGKYIANLEGDDYWTDPYKLQKQVDFMESNPQYIATVHPCIVVNETGAVIDQNPNYFSKSEHYSVSEFQKWILPGQTGTLVYRNIYLDDPSRDYSFYYKIDPILGDTTIFMMLVIQGAFYRFPEVMSCYRRVYNPMATSWSVVPLLDKQEKIYHVMDKLKVCAREEYGYQLDFSEIQEQIRYRLYVAYADSPSRHKKEILERIFSTADEKEHEYRALLRKVMLKTPLRKLKQTYYKWKKQHKGKALKYRVLDSVVYIRREADRQWTMNYNRSMITRQKLDEINKQNCALHLALLETNRKLNALAQHLEVDLGEVNTSSLMDAFYGNSDYSFFYPDLLEEKTKDKKSRERQGL